MASCVVFSFLVLFCLRGGIGGTYDRQLRPYLRALVWDYGESDDAIFQTQPADFAQGGEGGC